MIAEQIYQHNISDKIMGNILEQKEGLFYFIADETVAFPGYGNPINKEICDKYAINVIELPNEGGIIVSGSGSMSIGHFSKDLDNTFNENLTEHIIKYLRDRGLNASLYGNDILVDEQYKVASSGTRRFNEILFSTFHISHKVDIGLIKEICTKPMLKTPKGLADYGITEEDIKNLVEAYYGNL